MEKKNKLIAEFMGLTNHYNDNSIMLRETPEGNVVVHVYDLDYDSSWDWLMPVVEKVISKDYEFMVFEELKLQLWRVDIDAVYKAVVEFIKEYNDGTEQ